MTPTDVTRLSATIFLDTSIIDWTARRSWIPNKTTDLYTDALADFGRMTSSEQRSLQITLQECIPRWKAKAASNRAAMAELQHLDDEVSTVWACAESPDGPPEAFVKSELARQLELVAGAFDQAVSHAAIRLKALRTVMVRKAMLGPNADELYESPTLPLSIKKSRPIPSKTDRRNYEVILQLENRTFRSPKQYFHEIGQRCVKGRGKPVGHATINGWFKKQGLYGGREDRDIAALQARAVALAKKELAAIQPVSPDEQP